MANKSLDRLEKLRGKIDHADRALLKALGGRMKTVLQIAEFKRKQGLPLVQKGRWKELIRARLQVAEELGLDRDFTKAMFDLIHREALRLQRRKRKKK
jgi:chorismate mutase